MPDKFLNRLEDVDRLTEHGVRVSAIQHQPCGHIYQFDEDEHAAGLLGWPTNGGDELFCRTCENERLGRGHGKFLALEYAPVDGPTQNYAKIPHWLLRGKRYGLSKVERLLLMLLMSRQSGNAYAVSRIDTLARDADASESTIKRARRRLEDLGLIESKRRMGKANVYRVSAKAYSDDDARTRWVAYDLTDRSPVTSRLGHQRPVRDVTGDLTEVDPLEKKILREEDPQEEDSSSYEDDRDAHIAANGGGGSSTSHNEPDAVVAADDGAVAGNDISAPDASLPAPARDGAVAKDTDHDHDVAVSAAENHFVTAAKAILAKDPTNTFALRELAKRQAAPSGPEPGPFDVEGRDDGGGNVGPMVVEVEGAGVGQPVAEDREFAGDRVTVPAAPRHGGPGQALDEGELVAADDLADVGGVRHSGSSQVGYVGNRTAERNPPVAYVDGPCPDDRRCRHAKRFASGPTTCERCHPRADKREGPERVTKLRRGDGGASRGKLCARPAVAPDDNGKATVAVNPDGVDLESPEKRPGAVVAARAMAQPGDSPDGRSQG